MKTERLQLIKNCDDEIEEIETILKRIGPLSKERMYLTNYTLIKTCGTIEYVYRSIVADYFAERLGNHRIDQYLEKHVRTGSMGAKYENMTKLLKAFDPEWKNEFSKKVKDREDGNKLISSSNSLVYNRNLFSHGQSPSASFENIKDYYTDLKELIWIFDSVINSEGDP